MTYGKPPHERTRFVEVYKDQGGLWRWRLISRNGRIVATSGEGYRRERWAIRMARVLFPTDRIFDAAKRPL